VDATPRIAARAVVVFSTSAVVGHGVIGLLPTEWQRSATIVSEARRLEQLIGASPTPAIVDGDATGAAQAIRAIRSAGGFVVVLLGSGSQQLEPGVLEDADAILLHAEVEPVALRVALAAGCLGMRLLPRALPPSAPVPQAQRRPLSESGRRVLMLLSAGMRDAEMAHEMNLSQSAVRKLVQRTVHCMGARTRSQAVVMAARAGELGLD
jgi:DNA-binding NarL/FixJ family response regulator